MPPPLAAFLTLGFIVFLFLRDVRQRPNVTRALWLPLVWVVLCGSRGTSEWLNTFGISAGAASLEEGSPLDRLVYIGLIASGFNILWRRRIRLAEIVHHNRWMAIFLIYCLLAVLWSDFPFVALKRWIKVIGHPIMALIILTEPDPEQALTTMMKRAAYILLPVSVLFIKYYPEYGRTFSAWTGQAMNTGITTNKNLLGCDCLLLGFFWFWHFLRVRAWPKSKHRRNELILCLGFVWMVWWLVNRAESQTATVALVVGVAVLIFAGFSWVNKRMFSAYVICGLVGIILLETFFGIYEGTLKLLGRDATLTDRTLLWQDLLKVDINPVLGAGFESFWLGERIAMLWEKWAFRPNQAHNGYLETYLNLGIVGLVLLIAVLLASYGKAHRTMLTNLNWGRFRLGFLASILAYSWTEAAFKTTHLLFFVFYIIALDYPRRRAGRQIVTPPARGLTPEVASGVGFAQQRI